MASKAPLLPTVTLVSPRATLYCLAAPYGHETGVSPVPYRCFTSADEYCGNAGDYEGKSEGECENERMCVHANGYEQQLVNLFAQCV